MKIFLKKKKNRRYCSKEYKNLPEDEKQKLVEYRKIITKQEKRPHCN